MTSTIYLVRHAESEHNVTKDFSQRDPPLTDLGLAQATGLATTFPRPESVAVVMTSPLTRTLQTTFAAFGNILGAAPAGGKPAAKAATARLVVDPDLQERSDLPCDTGSDREELQRRVPQLLDSGADLDVLAELRDGWHEKQGAFAADDGAVAARAARVREKLRDLVVAELSAEGDDADTGSRDVVVVTHGVFMKFLAQDPSIDLPKAGWKAFTVQDGEGGDAVLVPV